jgi:hypothetical protein
MQFPIVGNTVLLKKWCDKENEYMSRRLFNVRSKLRMECPESFVFSKARPKTNNKNRSNCF